MVRGHSGVSGDLHLPKAFGGGSQIGRLRSCGENIITIMLLFLWFTFLNTSATSLPIVVEKPQVGQDPLQFLIMMTC